MVVRNIAVLAVGLGIAAFAAAAGADSASPFAPTTPGRFQVTQVSTTSITVTWSASTDNVAVAGYSLYRDDTGKLAFPEATRVHSTVELTYTFAELRCGSTYGLAVDAFDRPGNHSDPAKMLAATASCGGATLPAPDPAPAPTSKPAPKQASKQPLKQAPAAAPVASAPKVSPFAPTTPGNLRVTRSSNKSLRLAWSASTDNVAVAGYATYLDGAMKGSSSSLSSQLGGLACGRTYIVGVDAYDRPGNRSAKALLAAATAPCPDAQAPTTPSGFQQALTTGDAVVLTWAPSSDDTGVVSYGVYAGGLRVGSSTEATYTFTGLACGKTYSMSIDAADAAGNRSAQASVVVATARCADAQAPTQPTGIAVSSRSGTSVTLAWRAATDDVGVTEYGLYVGSAKTGSTTSTTATFSGLVCGTSYAFGVDAADAAGNRSQPGRITAATAACAPAVDTQAPSMPSGIAATGATQTSIALGWAPSTDNVGVTGYVVYRDGVEAGRPTSPAFGAASLSCGRSYRMGVEAFDAAGNRSPRAEANLATTACSDTSPPTTPASLQLVTRTATSISITWPASSDNVGVAGYGVYLGGSRVADTTQLARTLSGLACGVNHTIGVDAYDAAGNRSGMASVMIATTSCPDVVAPTTPTGLALSAVTQTSVQLSWNASTDNVGVVSYRVYKDGVAVADPTSATASVSGLACNTGYALSVDAVDAAGNRSARAAIAATTSPCQAASGARSSSPRPATTATPAQQRSRARRSNAGTNGAPR